MNPALVIMAIVVYLSALYTLWVAAFGVGSGRVRQHWGWVSRRTHPIAFWLFVAAHLLIGIIGLAFGTYLVMQA